MSFLVSIKHYGEVVAEIFRKWTIRFHSHPPLVIAPVETARKKQTIEGVQWHFRSAILDRLDEFFVCMPRLKRADPDAYKIFSRVGIAVPADRWVKPTDTTIIGPRIAVGGVSFPRVDDEGDVVLPSFIYFQKMIRPGFNVEPATGPIYRVTVLYDDRKMSQRWKSMLAFPVEMHLAVSADGKVTLLKELQSSVQRVVAKTAAAKRWGRATLISQRCWQYPSWLKNAASEDPSRGNFRDYAAGLFLMAYRTFAESIGEITIVVRRGDVSASFGVPLSRAPYFFADREATALAANGTKKKIFHSVKAHERRIAPDRVVEVRPHYRGLRHFDWNGYSIDITFPWRARDLLLSDGPGAWDSEQAEGLNIPYNWVNTQSFGQRVHAAILGEAKRG